MNALALYVNGGLGDIIAGTLIRHWVYVAIGSFAAPLVVAAGAAALLWVVVRRGL